MCVLLMFDTFLEVTEFNFKPLCHLAVGDSETILKKVLSFFFFFFFLKRKL